MHTRTALLAVALAASTVSAERAIAPGQMKRDILPRQTATDTTSPTSTDDPCVSAALSISSEIPTPGPGLESLEASYTGDACSFTIPGSLSAEYSSYTSSVFSWSSAHSADLASLFSSCTELGSLTDTADACATGGAGAGAGGASASASASASATGGTGSAAATATDGGSTGSTTTKATGTSAAGASSSSKTAAAGTGSSSAASASATAAGAGPAREVGIVGAVIAGVLGAVVAL